MTTPADPNSLDPRLRADLDDDLLAGLLRWQQDHDAQVLLDSWLDGGYTPAKVGTVVIDFAETAARKYVMKVCPSGVAGTREGDAHARALVSGPADFVARHLVEQPYPPTFTADGGMIMFQTIAGGSLEAIRPLSALYDNADLPAAAAKIARSLLTDWNPDACVERVSAHKSLRIQLGIGGEHEGALNRWATIVGPDSSSPWLRFEQNGDVLPNPLVWLRHGRSEGEDEMLFLMGRAHGDLHLDNVMVRLAPGLDADSYRLIDLSGWQEHAPLCRDLPHLLLATIGKHLSALTAAQRRSLAKRIIDRAEGVPVGPGTLRNQGLEGLTDALLGAGDDWANELDMIDDWHRQLLLGVVASALIQTSVSVHATENRWWFFELAATGLGRFLASEQSVSADGTDLAFVGPQAAQDVDAAASAERLDEAAAAFSGRKTTVLVVGEAGLGSSELISRQPWDLVVEFDPATDETGAYAHRAQGRDNRLVTYEQPASFGRQSTVWLAADGLDGSSRGPEALRDWRRACLPGIRNTVASLARSSSRPVCICTAGELGGKARAVVETLLDAFTTRVDLLTVGPQLAEGLRDYGPEVLRVDPTAVLGTLQDRSTTDPGGHEPTLPGQAGPVVIGEDALDWHAEVGEVVHSEAGRAVDRRARVAEGFYRGGTIAWLELDIGADLPRRETGPILERMIGDLADRGTWRVSLRHYPGAGGTTVARRIAWDVHADYPTFVAERVSDHAPLASRVRELHQRSGLSVLVIVESTLESVIDRAFSALRADSVPAVLLIVERRAVATAADSQRSFYLPGLTKPEDREEFARVFGERVPERHPALLRLARSPAQALAPFLFGLTTYQEDYLGLEGYVQRSLERTSNAEREALKLVALVHRYAGLATPAALLANALEVPDGVYVDVRARVSPEVLTLLIEHSNDEWRTSHHLVADEMLSQLLAPPSTAGPMATDAWKVSLSTIATRLIEQAAREFGELLPDDVSSIIDQLFIVRDNQSVFTGERESFSELMGHIPSLEGRIEVMRKLTEAFPVEPHYSAHLGRLLSYQARDHSAALVAIDQAISLDPEDDVLFHMKGMILRNLMGSIVENRGELPPELLHERVLAVVGDARREFERAIELNDVSQYGYVALAQLCTKAIEFGRAQSDTATYGEFLSRPEAGYYRELLAVAEESLERIREIRGGDRPSRYSAGAEAELQAFYDDYAAVLQGWRNLLDRADIAKPPVRRQLVRAYLRRAGTWRSASAGDRARAIELLEENLRDDPSDTRSLMEWMRAGRFGRVGLDRAAEFVSYSVGDPTRATRDTLYYDYVISCLLALGGRDTAVADYKRKLYRSRERAAAFGNRRYIYEWYTQGSGLGQLVNHNDLRDWERSVLGPDPELLDRLYGRVDRIRLPQSGEIMFGPGLRAFFTPGAANLLAGRDENRRVSFLLGFAYEGPQAWSVQLHDAT